MAQAGISSSGIPPACEPTGGSQQEDIRKGTATHIRALGLTREKAAELQGYIRRLLWALVHLGVIPLEAANDPWGPPLSRDEFANVGRMLEALKFESQGVEGVRSVVVSAK